MSAKRLSIIHAKRMIGKLAGWRLASSGSSISKQYRLKDFGGAVKFVCKIAALAEKMNHHPDLHITRYKRLRVVLTTHDAGGLTQKDFALAANIDRIGSVGRG